MKRILTVLVIFLAAITVVACGGGGGGGSAPSDPAPTLNSISISPDNAVAGTTDVQVTFTFNFSDSGGNLNGGSLNATIDGQTVNIPLGSGFAGMTSGTGTGTIQFTYIGASIGAITIPCTLTDAAGHTSNSMNLTFTRNAPTFPVSWGELSQAYAVTMAPDGTLLVAGTTHDALDGQGNAYFNAFVRKFTTNGVSLGSVVLSSLGARAKTVFTDASGNIYFAGSTTGNIIGTSESFSNGPVGYVAKYDADGNKTWIKYIGQDLTDVSVNGVAVDSSGNVYATGYFSGSLFGIASAGAKDAFLAKYDSNGNYLWSVILGGGGDDVVQGIALDASGNIYFTGYTGSDTFDGLANPSPGWSRMFIAKVNASGMKLWSQTLGANLQNYYGWAVSVAPSGNIYVGGGADIDMAFLAKYDSSGNQLWKQAPGYYAVSAIAISPAEDIFVTGTTHSLAKYDVSGNLQWSKSATGAIIVPVSQAYGLVYGTDNYIYMVGSGQSDTTLATLLKFDANGVQQ